jgi:hypothetical protein
LRVVTVAFYGYVGGMRSMLIRPFPGSKIQFTDLEFLIKTRLTNDLVLWPGQAVALVAGQMIRSCANIGLRFISAMTRQQ